MFALCLLGLIGVWVWYFLVGSKPVPAPPAVVTLSVLPFTGDEQFTVELMGKLAKVPGLRTIKGSAPEADAILKGTTQNSNDHLRVTAQLIDSKTNFQLWSQTYERDAKDANAITDELVKAVLKVLRVPEKSGAASLGGRRLSAGAVKPATSLSAHPSHPPPVPWRRSSTWRSSVCPWPAYPVAAHFDSRPRAGPLGSGHRSAGRALRQGGHAPLPS
jgi:hypothetical protein